MSFHMQTRKFITFAVKCYYICGRENVLHLRLNFITFADEKFYYICGRYYICGWLLHFYYICGQGKKVYYICGRYYICGCNRPYSYEK